MEKTPEPLSGALPNVPPELEAVIAKGLAKATDQRYQSIREFVADLKEIRRLLDLEASLQRALTKSSSAFTSCSRRIVASGCGAGPETTRAPKAGS